MLMARRQRKCQSFGTLQMGEAEKRCRDGNEIIVQPFRWTPSGAVTLEGLEDFHLDFVEIRQDDLRAIRPAEGVMTAMPDGRVKESPFFHEAHLGGMAIQYAMGAPLEHRQLLNTAYLYVGRFLATGAWLRRQYNGPKDFYVSANIRMEMEIEPLASMISNGRLSGTSALMELGKEVAQREGIEKPNSKQIVQHALFALAKDDPIQLDSLSPEKTRGLVRMALLESEWDRGNVTDEELQFVLEEFVDILESRLDKTDEDFYESLEGPKNSVVTQITRRLEKRGMEIPRDRVTAALAELGFRGIMQWVGNLEVLMRSVAAELTEPLTGANLKRFEVLYYPQPWLDNKPLFLFAERFGFLQRGIEELLFSSDVQRSSGIILRMLEYYGMLSWYRREADRTRKRLENQPSTIGGSAVEGFAFAEPEEDGDFDDLYV